MAYQIVQYYGGRFDHHIATGFDTARAARQAATDLQEEGYQCGLIRRTVDGYQFMVGEWKN